MATILLPPNRFATSPATSGSQPMLGCNRGIRTCSGEGINPLMGVYVLMEILSEGVLIPAVLHDPLVFGKIFGVRCILLHCLTQGLEHFVTAAVQENVP